MNTDEKSYSCNIFRHFRDVKKDLYIDGIHFLTAREAGDVLGYAPDYISRLCREGKLKGRLSGKNWLVEADSLIPFIKQHEAKKQAWHQDLSRELKSVAEPVIMRDESFEPLPRANVAPRQLHILRASEKAHHAREVAQTRTIARIAGSSFIAVLLLFVANVTPLSSLIANAVHGVSAEDSLAAASSVFSPIDSFARATFNGINTVVCSFSSWCDEMPESAVVYVRTPGASNTATTPTNPVATNITNNISNYIQPVVERLNGVSEQSLASRLLDLETSLTGRIDLALYEGRRQTEDLADQFSDGIGGGGFDDIDITDSTFTGGSISGASLSGVNFSGEQSFDALSVEDATSTNATSTNLYVSGSFGFGSDTGLLRNTAGSVSTLANGSNGQVLKMVSGNLQWSADLTGGGGGGSSFFSTTTDDLAIYPADPSHVVIIGDSSTTTIGNILEIAGNSLFRGAMTSYGDATAPRFVATSSVASLLPYASTTMITATTASTTNLVVSGISGSLLRTNAQGQVVSAIAGTDYLDTTANLFSTTSADYWETQRDFFSTTSTDYWKSVNDLFSTTSASYFLSQNQGNAFSTTSAINFIHASTTIPKTYTANSFTALQTFGNASTTAISSSYASSTNAFFGSLSVGSLSGVLKATAGAISAGLVDLASEVTGILGVARGGTGWNTVQAGSLLYGNDSSALATTSAGTGGQVLALVGNVPTWVATTTFSSGLVYSGGNVTLDTSGNWGGTFDGLEGSAYLANSFSTTSAQYFASLGLAFSTTSSDAWKDQRNFFSTTSASYFLAQNQGNAFSTTSAINFVHSSTTIPKTYAPNVFSALQTFGNASSTLFSSTYASTTNLFAGTLTLGSLNGPLQANNGAISATTSIGVLYGGTGLTSAPSYGQLLLGQSDGTYQLVATSSLGITGGSSFSYPFPNNATSTTLTFTNGLMLVGSTTINGNATTTGMLGVGSLFINNEHFSDLTGTGLQNSGGVLTLDTSGNWGGTFDGLEGSAYLANSFSTTSANYLLSTYDKGFFFSTTSAEYWGSTKGYSTFGYLFPSNATTTLLAFNGGLSAYASTTIGNGTQGGGLTISGGATTTGLLNVTSTGTSTFSGNLDVLGALKVGNSSLYLTSTSIQNLTGNLLLQPNSGNVGIGTTTPYSPLSVSASASRLQTWERTGVNNFSLGISNSGGLDHLYLGSENNAGDFVLKEDGKVGIGTTTPWAKLSVHSTAGIPQFVIGSSTATQLIVDASGNVGIGTAAPTTALHVRGSMTLDGAAGTSRTTLFSTNGFPRWDFGANATAESGSNVGSDFVLNRYNDAGTYVDTPLSITRGDGKMYLGNFNSVVTSTGFIGIGTTTPDGAMLHLQTSGDGSVSSPHLRLTESGDAREVSFYNRNGGLYLITHGTDNVTDEALTLDTGIASIYTGGTERFRINASGNVGIGTTTPLHVLSVSGASGLDGATPVSLQLTSTSNGGWTAQSVIAQVLFDSADISGGAGTRGAIKSVIEDITGNDSALSFWTTTTGAPTLQEQMRINHAGNVGIGTTTPAHRLNVYTGSAAIAGMFQGSGSAALAVGSLSGTGWIQAYTNDSATAADDLSLQTVGGNVGVGGTSPLSRLTVDVGGSGDNGTVEFRMGQNEASARDFIIRKNTSNPYGLEIIGAANPTVDAGFISFKTSDQTSGEKVRITSSGNVGIGTTIPSAPLTVFGDTYLDSAGTTDRILYFRNQSSVGTVQSDLALRFNAGNTERMRILSTGNVGIGTTTPISTLSVQGSLCVRNTGSCGTTAGTIYATTAAISDIDLAENYRAIDATLMSSEIVSLHTSASSTIRRAVQGEEALGVLSTKPGLLLGQEIKDGRAVALKGRVPLKVNMEGGPIAIGDRLTISSVPGVGTKATTSSYTVARALEAAATNGEIEVFVENEYTLIVEEKNALRDLLHATSSASTPVFANIFARMTMWLADAGNGITEIFAKTLRAENVYADTVNANKLCLEDLCVTKAELQQMLNNSDTTPAPTPESEPSTEEPADESVTEEPPAEEPQEDTLESPTTPPAPDAIEPEEEAVEPETPESPDSEAAVIETTDPETSPEEA